MPEIEYLTVGQFARKVGVTVRTIQYYDQQNLLEPSAKGSHNQRLYTSADAETLYKILTLKYLGLSLSEIKEHVDEFDNPEAFKVLVGKTMAQFQKEFQETFKRLSTLNSLFIEAKDRLDRSQEVSENPEKDSICWQRYIDIIEEGQKDKQFFWHDMAQSKPGDSSHSDLQAQKRADEIALWHELIADTIFALGSHMKAEDERAAVIAQRYSKLGGSDSLSQGFLLMENIVPEIAGETDGSFDALRLAVTDFLKRAEEFHIKHNV